MAATASPRKAPATNGSTGPLSGRDLLEHLTSEVVETAAGPVRVHALGVSDMLDFVPRARAVEDGDDVAQARLMVEMVARGLDISVDEAGRIGLAIIKPLFEAVSRISGLDPGAIAEAVESLKEVPSDES